MSLFKEKSWVVRLVDGYVLNDRVRASRCRDCLFTPQLVLGNNGDTNLMLYGCNISECKHVLIRVNLSENTRLLWTIESTQPEIELEKKLESVVC